MTDRSGGFAVMPNETWLATELFLAMLFIGLLVIAAVCCDTAHVDGDVDLDDDGYRMTFEVDKHGEDGPRNEGDR
jgi:hypothetical protein